MTFKAKPIESRDRNQTAPVSVALEFRAFLSGQIDDLGEMHEEFNAAVRAFYAKCEQKGVAIIQANGVMRGLTREEAIVLIPRKIHMNQDGRHICDTPFVAKKYLTDNEEQVTCRLCLKKLGRIP